MNVRSLSIYFLPLFAILSWWTLAFKPALSKMEISIESPPPPQITSTPLLAQLSPLDRGVLKQALLGDFALMAKLIADWDLDAQILRAKGLFKIRRLPRKAFLKSQLLGRDLQTRPSVSKIKFLPQTYAAASFLLAIAEPEQIVALPRGLRKQSHIYPESLTSRIPLEIDRYNSEKLFLTKPDIAFVSSHYSHPSAIQALLNQGIGIHDTKSLATLENIYETLKELGKAADRKKEAALLCLFIKASLQTIENRLLAQNHDTGSRLLDSKILYVNYHDRFYLPSSQTFAYQLLTRLNIPCPAYQSFYTSLEKETLVNINPDCLIISSFNVDALKKQITADPTLKDISAIRQNKIFFVDDEIQQTPTQFVVLAYFDLAEVIAQANLP